VSVKHVGALACALLSVLAAAWPSAAPAAESPLVWFGPVVIDQPPSTPHYPILAGVSCVSEALCVAVDHSGNVLVSGEPASLSDGWQIDAVAGSDQLDGVSCPSASLCVAVGGGHVVTSTDPAAGAGAWSAATIVKARGLNSVSCPSSSLCVAVDSAGDVLTSTDPAGGAGEWTVTPVDLDPRGYMGADDIYTVSCASASMCVAFDFLGNVLSSTDPTGGAGAWTRDALASAGSLYAVSCPAVSLCVVGNWTGELFTSGDPTGPPSAWAGSEVDPEVAGHLGPNHLVSVSCATTSLCVAADQFGTILASGAPTGGSAAWSSRSVDGAGAITGISCLGSGLCVAVDAAGNALIGETHPTLSLSAVSVPVAALLARGLPVSVRCSRACTASIRLRLGASVHARLTERKVARLRKGTLLGATTVALAAGEARTVLVPVGAGVAHALRRLSHIALVASAAGSAHAGPLVASTALIVGR
jgi:hypothetical protein